MRKEHIEYIDKLWRQHAQLMVQLTYRRTGDAGLSEDLVQEAFLTACYKIEVVVHHEKPAAWLYSTLHKLTMREMARAHHKMELPLLHENTVDYLELEFPIEQYLPKGLTTKEREIILLRIEAEAPFAAIAEQRGISEEACRQQLSRALRKCRMLMGQTDAEKMNA